MVRYLHISLKPIPAYASSSTEVRAIGNTRPGLWFGHDLSWIDVMNARHTWYPTLLPRDSFPYNLRALYTTVLGGSAVPPKGEGEAMASVRYPPHYLYQLPLEESLFRPVGSAPAKDAILRITATTLPALIDAYRAYWATNPIPTIARDFDNAFTDAKAGNPERVAILKLLGYDTLPKSKVPSVTDLRRGEDREKVLKALVAGKLRPGKYMMSTVILTWRTFLDVTTEGWGGLDFADDLFADPDLAEQFPFLNTLDAPSGVLFTPEVVLKTTDPAPHLLAVVAWEPMDPPAIQVGVTTTGELRIVSKPSGGRRRRTRRRMLKNPKTLKKRIR